MRSEMFKGLAKGACILSLMLYREVRNWAQLS
jgi:hypothetical protein